MNKRNRLLYPLIFFGIIFIFLLGYFIFDYLPNQNTPKYTIVETKETPIFATYRVITKSDATEKELMAIFKKIDKKEYEVMTIWFYSSLNDVYGFYTVGMIERKTFKDKPIITVGSLIK